MKFHKQTYTYGVVIILIVLIASISYSLDWDNLFLVVDFDNWPGVNSPTLDYVSLYEILSENYPANDIRMSSVTLRNEADSSLSSEAIFINNQIETEVWMLYANTSYNARKEPFKMIENSQSGRTILQYLKHWRTSVGEVTFIHSLTDTMSGSIAFCRNNYYIRVRSSDITNTYSVANFIDSEISSMSVISSYESRSSIVTLTDITISDCEIRRNLSNNYSNRLCGTIDVDDEDAELQNGSITIQNTNYWSQINQNMDYSILVDTTNTDLEESENLILSVSILFKNGESVHGDHTVANPLYDQ